MSDDGLSGGTGKHRSWVLGGLVAYLLAVLVILVLPVSYAGIVNAVGDWLQAGLGVRGFGTGWIEFVANILMFAPSASS